MLLADADGIESLLDRKIIKELQEKGIETVREFLSAFEVGDLSGVGRPISSFKPAYDAFMDKMQPKVFALDAVSACSLVKTTVGSLDKVLQGGFRGRRIYELFGAPGVGKTQLCLQIAVTSCLEAATGDCSVLYMDTKNDFSFQRFAEMARSRLTSEARGRGKRICRSKEDEDGMLENLAMRGIKLAKVFDLNTCVNTLDSLLDDMEETDLGEKGKVLILDNVATLILPRLEKGSLQSTFGVVARMVARLRQVANEHNLAVVTVNNALNNDGAVKPALGKLYSEAADVRLHLDFCRDVGGGRRKLTVNSADWSFLQRGASCKLHLSGHGFGEIEE